MKLAYVHPSVARRPRRRSTNPDAPPTACAAAEGELDETTFSPGERVILHAIEEEARLLLSDGGRWRSRSPTIRTTTAKWAAQGHHAARFRRSSVSRLRGGWI